MNEQRIFDLFKKMDWSLFHQQKQSLLAAMNALPLLLRESRENLLRYDEHLTGILHVLDEIQDIAIDELGIEAANAPSPDESEETNADQV